MRLRLVIAGLLCTALTVGVGAVPRPAGSCIVVAITDGPLDGAACQRAARRAGLGLARCGSTAHHGSGEIFLALATGLRAPRGTAPPRAPVTGRALDDYFAAVAEATEEAVINSLLQSVTVTGTPAELTLWSMGRGRAAHVTLDGPGEAVAQLTAGRG